ncbi:hypothetical protein AB0H88_31525 [Nonomuraea sp. NPDC050680]|uniref:hypothetical protein n=1 Tax=Nonomuraea sp. NPDC050680 TaxID=3154630 RepID=UPI0033ECA539
MIIAAVTAALAQWTTGIFGTTGDRLLGLVTGNDPVTVAGRHAAPLGPRAGGKQVAGMWRFETPNFAIVPTQGTGTSCLVTTMVPRPAAEISPPEWTDDWEHNQAALEAWAVANRAGDPDTTLLRLTVTAKPGKTVVLEGARSIFLTRAPKPRTGTLVQFQIGSGCGAHVDVRSFTTDLDDAAGLWRPAKVEKSNFPYTVKNDEPEILELTARTKACDCAWQVELAWTDGANKGKTIVDAGDGPFHTLPAKGYPRAAWAYDKDTGWQLAPGWVTS